ncbi:Transposase and inactivated derivatives [Legionella lansingensis]|uniref:Transposase IS200 like protein n=1 Tax=Legionella lansingensis TaxID=45067 RepID=A0A0W0VF46_9GAMM|nr:transposase [Legionella lansingensis]KTD18727.1 Transposase IS200 like protein [Legionella lansingensis]SNV58214.1 Transposase and inactivated derivatives [Legionella lansingensis]
MRRYRRSTVAGATYFFTLNLQNRKSTILINHIDKLRFAFKKVQVNHPFKIDAIIILPDHLHLMMTLPIGDVDYSKRLNLIKGMFSRQIAPYESISLSRQKKREREIWQRRFWEHCIRNNADYEQHINYIHYNPVKHHYVSSPSRWPYSSIHRFIQSGILPVNWACNDEFHDGHFGE